MDIDNHKGVKAGHVLTKAEAEFFNVMLARTKAIRTNVRRVYEANKEKEALAAAKAKNTKKEG